MKFKVGDWATHDMGVVQIKKIDDEGYACISDGWFETSGKLADRLRPLTLRSKRIVEWFDIVYTRLKDIDGEVGFNYPRISQHFSQLAIQAIDCDEDDQKAKQYFDQADAFVSEAREYKPMIQGVALFRPKVGF